MTDPIKNLSADDIVRWHRVFAPRFFNHTWELMDLEERDEDATDEMLSSAFAQRAHWYQVGDARRRAIADWQVARAAVLAGYPDLARRFGQRCLEESGQLDPFIIGFAHEAIARAAAAVDDVETFSDHMQAARDVVGQIGDPEERDILIADLDEMTRRETTA